jgi:hypothetical protein
VKNRFYTILILLFCIQINAQNIFKKGYFLNNSGDTITGYIKDFSWNNNPEEILFKSDLSDSQIKFLPKDIKHFEIYGEVKYKSAQVDIDISGNSSSLISENRSPSFVKQHLFLKKLEEGQANLYQYRDRNTIKYFFSTEEVSLQPLIFRKYLDKNSVVKKNNDFRQQLLNELKCETLSESDFKNLKYWEIGLRRVITKYNSCSDNSTYSYINKKSKSSFHITIRPGLQLASFSTEEGSENVQTDFNTEVNFRIGIEFEYVLPLNNKKWSLVLEPTYQSYSSRKDRPFGDLAPSFREVDYQSIEIPLSLRHYLFLSSESQLFLNGGLAYDLNIEGNKITSDLGASIDLKGSLNPVIGFGFRYDQKFSVEFRYQTYRDLLNEDFFRESNYSSFAFILGYRML